MDTLPEEPAFSPALFETGAGASWRFSHAPTFSMNEWFIAGPGPGIYRDDWLRDVKAFREQVRAGKGRVIEMNATAQDAWFRPVAAVANALRLVPGESLYVALKARVRTGENVVLHLLCIGEGQYLNASDAAIIEIPDDGEWHNVETTITVPTDATTNALLYPVVALKHAPEKPAQVEVSSVIVGIDDTERMVALSRVVDAAGDGHLCRGIYDREDLAWAASAFTQYFVFMYDRSFYDPERGYQVEAFIEDKNERFGGVDSVILWPAYPRIGADDRNQFDFFRDLPGGLEGLRELCQQFQKNGVRVLLPYLPWDQGTRDENLTNAGAIVALARELGAGGIFLDTLTNAPPELGQSVSHATGSIVLVPELCPPVEQLSLCNASWAQWPHDPIPPGMPLLKWMEPRHTQHYTCRWERNHQREMETAFFNGTGMLLWENIFGTHNPCTEANALFWKRCSSILHSFSKEFTSELWDPFYPTMNEDLYVHRWPGAPTTLFTLRNLGEPIKYGLLIRWQLPSHVRADNMQVKDLWHGCAMRWDMTEFGWVQIWGDVEKVSCIAVTFGDDSHLDDLMATQAALNSAGEAEENLICPAPLLKPVAKTVPTTKEQAPAGMALVPGGAVSMRLEHQRRECGCYPDPGSNAAEFIWGSPHDGMVTHDYEETVPPYYIDEAQVSNRAFQQFLQATNYTPKHAHNFLKHWPDGVMPESTADLPVVYVDLDDARAYARWAGKRLPTEVEWQHAAQGEDGRLWPWGNDFDAERSPPAGASPMPVRSLPESRSPYGCYLMAGNVWEWTESERDDGHTRFCIIRGGSHYRIEGSGWYVPTGPQPLDKHTKFLLLWPGLDRCATIGFRCVQDMKQP